MLTLESIPIWEIYILMSYFHIFQMNFDFRKKWDRLVVKLDVIETDENSSSDVIHWITHFPVSYLYYLNTSHWYHVIFYNKIYICSNTESHKYFVRVKTHYWSRHSYTGYILFQMLEFLDFPYVLFNNVQYLLLRPEGHRLWTMIIKISLTACFSCNLIYVLIGWKTCVINFPCSVCEVYHWCFVYW